MSEDVHALVGAYALGAVDDVERLVFERHLAQCADCQGELPSLLAAVAKLGGAQLATPPAQLRASVMARVARTTQLAPLTAPSGHRRRSGLSRVLAVAASIAVVLGIGGVAVEQQRLVHERDRSDRIAAVASDPDKRTRVMPVVGGGTAEITDAGGAALVSLRGLPTAPDNRTYQLWKKLPDDSVVSLGVLGRSPSKTTFVDNLGNSTALAVTIERDGGADQPTTTPTVVMPL